MLKIVVPERSKAIKILAPVFQKEFVKLGIKTKVIFSSDLDKVPGTRRDKFFVFVPHKFDKFERNGINKSAVFIMYQQEQLSDRIESGIMRTNQIKPLIDKYDFVVEIEKSNVKFLEKIGRHPDMIMPIAYHELFEFGENETGNSEYECLFFGRVADKPRRQEILNRLSKVFKFYPQYEQLYNDDLKKVILSSRIILNIHQSLINFPEWLRLMLAMANKRLVVSEPILDASPLVEGEHIIFAEHEKMAEKIRYFLAHDKEYKIITENAYNFVKKHYRMDFYLKKFAERFLNKNES